MKKKRPAGILKALENAGYEAYYVGGCVRDTLLGREIHDWDIATSAMPEETMTCFEHCVPTGIRHGTVTVLTDEGQAEVTTYRTDGDYHDGRHPDQVTFVRSLPQDLARRDFTINAMAMSNTGELVDPYDGRTDLKKHLIRCVGNPEQRFQEDALRMLRAVRFSAQLGFAIEDATRCAIVSCAELCKSLSMERIRDEIEKTLMSEHPEGIAEMAELGLLTQVSGAVPENCRWLAELPPIPVVRWAGLCRCWPGLNLTALRLDRKTARYAMEASNLTVPESRLGWKYLIAEQGKESAELVAALAGEQAVVEELFQSGECLSLRQLAVNGKDFPGLHGKELGDYLHSLLYHVLNHPEDNQKEILLKFSKNSIDYCY